VALRIGLNATCYNERPSGARQRFIGLYGALVRRFPETEFIIYEPRDCAVSSWFGEAPNLRAVRTPLPSALRWNRSLRGLGYWRSQLAADRLDLFETFNLPLVRAPRCPTILTVHDAWETLAVVPMPERIVARATYRHALRGADRVITVSETMKRELQGLEPRASITTLYNGIDAGRFKAVSEASVEAVRQRLGLPPEFILAVGHVEKRKNYPPLIEAMVQLRDTRPDLSLVIVGNDSGELPALAGLIDQLGLRERVVIRQDVTDDELDAIYSLSRLVVFPSVYEGFGIPVLESMAVRRPIVLSDLPVFIELTEGKVEYFSPTDAKSIAAAIGRVLDSPERQRDLVSYGEGRIGDFDFDRLASELAEIHRKVLSRG
jgi:glycosyltransferase involved in cell wall biosynthesis